MWLTVYVLYLDESGVPQRIGQTSHYALAGIAIPARTWTRKRDELRKLRDRYGLGTAEIHVAWLLRPYVEQTLAGFDTLPWDDRRKAVVSARRAKLRQLPVGRQKSELARFYRRTDAYIHLALAERRQLAMDVCDLVLGWDDAVLFGEVADKSVSQPFRPDESAYEQVVSRFDAFLGRAHAEGVVTYDRTDPIVERFLDLTARFQQVGGIWRRVRYIPGHPFFVDSQTSDMVQIADVLAYGLRRYCEKREDFLLQRYFLKFDRRGRQLVGLRHYRGGRRCHCMICMEPRTQPRTRAKTPRAARQPN